MQAGPLLLIIFVMLLSSLFTLTPGGGSVKNYSFSYQQSYNFPVQVLSYRLNQNYFISQWSANELRQDLNKKYKVRNLTSCL
jgi:hypothetical protein